MWSTSEKVNEMGPTVHAEISTRDEHPVTTTSAGPDSARIRQERPAEHDDGQSRAHRVVIVDSREERRAVTSMLVGKSPLLVVVGLAANLEEASEVVRTEQADVALIEIQLPVPEGLTTIRGLRDRFPDLRVVVSSFHDNPATREQARIHGADGYLSKPLQVEALVAAVLVPAL